MKHLPLLVFCAMALSNCNKDEPCLIGSGQTSEYQLNLPSFDKISMSGPFDVEFTQGSPQTVTIIAEAEVFGLLRYQVVDDYLDLSVQSRCTRSNFDIKVLLALPDLTKVNCSGDCDFNTTDEVDLDRLSLNVTGAGSVSMDGLVQDMRIECSGALNVHNFGLQTSSTDMDISGAADLDVHCTAQLNIDVSGAATVRYIGRPAITQDVSGFLELIDSN